MGTSGSVLRPVRNVQERRHTARTSHHGRHLGVGILITHDAPVKEVTSVGV